MHSQVRGTPGGCRPVCRSGRVNGGIDSAMRMSAQQSSATVPSRCHFGCGASPAAAECDVYASRSGWMPHHSRGRLAHRRAGIGARPRRPCRRGIASTRARASCESFRSAPVRRIASGTPRASQIKCRLLPRLARSVGFGPVCVPPHTALTEQLSTTARDQSTSPLRASQLRSAKCIRSQTPSCCQSRRCRQQVIPDPQPSSFGNICHGIPLRSTKRMPVTHARSGTRGRPPFGRGGEGGRSGSIRFHSASGNSTAAIKRRR